MDKIAIGDICVFDKNNKYNMSTDKIIFVRVTDIISKGFSRYYRCIITDRTGTPISDSSMDVKKAYLSRIDDNTVVVVRHPNDTPIINKMEVELLKNIRTVCYHNLNDNGKTNLDKLIMKMELFATIINEY